MATRTRTRAPDVRATADYSMFSYFKENRLIDPTNFEHIKSSVEKKNLLHLEPIIVNEDFYVVDGQHRLEVAKDLEVLIYFMVGDNLTEKDAIIINANKRTWALSDYLHFYCERGREQYLELRQFKKQHKLNITDAIALMGYRGSSARSSELQKFKHGGFSIESRETAEEIVAMINNLHEYWDFAKTRSFIRAFIKAYRDEEFRFERLWSKVQQASPMVRRAPNARMYLRQINEIYNYNAHNTVHLT